jgi:hypothetical protein
MTPRRYRLKSWFIRSLVPEGAPGAYVLWTPTMPVYVGRSDTCLRRRLLEHARSFPDFMYFTYNVTWRPQDAFVVECSLFHALGDTTLNLSHPQRARASDHPCGFCLDTISAIQKDRLALINSV